MAGESASGRFVERIDDERAPVERAGQKKSAAAGFWSAPVAVEENETAASRQSRATRPSEKVPGDMIAAQEKGRRTAPTALLRGEVELWLRGLRDRLTFGPDSIPAELVGRFHVDGAIFSVYPVLDEAALYLGGIRLQHLFVRREWNEVV
jgi:hypothetical protein